MKNEEIINHPNYCPLLFKGLLIADGNEVMFSHCPTSGSSTDFEWIKHNQRNWLSDLPYGCKNQCKDLELQGKHSFRQANIHWIKRFPDVDLLKPEIFRLDFITGNHCNAKCIICNPGASSAWAHELNVDVIPYLSNPEIINDLDLSLVKILHLTGGEPLMSKNILPLFDKIASGDRLSDIEVQINTNGSVTPSDEIIEYWKRCKSVELFASIDAIGTAFEYIRYPLVWSQVEGNLSKLSSISDNIHVRIATSVGVHNIDELANTYNWFKSKQQIWKMADSAFGFNPVWGGLTLNNASSALKNVWREKIPTQFDNHIGTETVKIFNERDGDNNIWVQTLDTIDQRRKLNWKNALPLLYDSYKKSQTL